MSLTLCHDVFWMLEHLLDYKSLELQATSAQTCNDCLLEVLGRQGRHGGHCDAQGFQHLPRLLWRVGEWCKGESDGITCALYFIRAGEGDESAVADDVVVATHPLTMMPTGLGPTRISAVQSWVRILMKAAHARPQHTMAGRAC